MRFETFDTLTRMKISNCVHEIWTKIGNFGRRSITRNPQIDFRNPDIGSVMRQHKIYVRIIMEKTKILAFE